MLGERNQYQPASENPPLSEALQRTLVHGYHAVATFADAPIGRAWLSWTRQGGSKRSQTKQL